MFSGLKVSFFVVFALLGMGFSQTQTEFDKIILLDKTVYDGKVKVIKDNTICFDDQETGIEYEIDKSKILTVILASGKVLTFSNSEQPKLNRECVGGNPQIDVEFGGNVSFSYSSTDNTYNTLLSINPSIVKYFSSFFIGPILGLSVNWYKINTYSYDYYYNYYGPSSYSGTEGEYFLGARFGTLLSQSNPNWLPYFASGICAAWLDNGSSTGLSIPVELGVKNRIGSSAFINYAIQYNYLHFGSTNSNTIGFNIGLSLFK